jgi:hypothetical protein
VSHFRQPLIGMDHAPFCALEPRADVRVMITMVSMIMPIISAQPLPGRGADDHHRPVILGRRRVTARSRPASRGVLLCAANATNSAAAVPQVGRRLFFGGGDLRLITLWRQTMRLAQIIIFLVGALAAVGLLIMEMIMESMAS